MGERRGIERQRGGRERRGTKSKRDERGERDEYGKRDEHGKMRETQNKISAKIFILFDIRNISQYQLVF